MQATFTSLLSLKSSSLSGPGPSLIWLHWSGKFSSMSLGSWKVGSWRRFLFLHVASLAAYALALLLACVDALDCPCQPARAGEHAVCAEDFHAMQQQYIVVRSSWQLGALVCTPAPLDTGLSTVTAIKPDLDSFCTVSLTLLNGNDVRGVTIQCLSTVMYNALASLLWNIQLYSLKAREFRDCLAVGKCVTEDCTLLIFREGPPSAAKGLRVMQCSSLNRGGRLDEEGNKNIGLWTVWKSHQTPGIVSTQSSTLHLRPV